MFKNLHLPSSVLLPTSSASVEQQWFALRKVQRNGNAPISVSHNIEHAALTTNSAWTCNSSKPVLQVAASFSVYKFSTGKLVRLDKGGSTIGEEVRGLIQ